MSAKVTLFHSKLKKIDTSIVRALEKTAEALHTEIVQAQVIPMEKGHMQNDHTFVDTSGSASGHCEIITSAPQARRLYYHPEYTFSKDKNPNAKAHWFEDWAEGGSKERSGGRTFAKMLKQEAGNAIK